MRKLGLVILICLVMAVFGCGGKKSGGGSSGPLPSSKPSPAKSPAEMKWVFEPKAIKLNLFVDKKLNEYGGHTHTLLLCVYQLTDPSKFRELTADKTGLSKLLQGKRFDQSVKHVQQIFVQPGQKQNLELDRAEGAKFLAVAAGYYNLDPGASSRVWQFPMNVNKSGWWWWKKTSYTPKGLTANLLLGPKGIQKIGE